MLNLPVVLTAIIVAALAGVAATGWVRSTRRRRLEADEAVRSLAAMRWREFSRFVIEALQAQGFEAARGEVATQTSQEADLVLDRNGETWLLSVKQGANYRITAKMVDELARAVRFRHAQGGILATLGSIEPGAGRDHPQLELLDGPTLWPLVDPLLPPTLHQDIQARADARVRRETGIAWGAAAAVGLLAGLVLGLLLPARDEAADTPAPTISAPRTPPATPQPAASGTAAPSPPATVPLDEDAAREALARAITTVPGVERATWSTRSTLALYMSGEATDAQVAAICAVVERDDTLRAVRLQLQPPPGAGRVRFLQCRAF